jgi:glycosyltransferase involved in cell wall biosynthesis
MLTAKKLGSFPYSEFRPKHRMFGGNMETSGLLLEKPHSNEQSGAILNDASDNVVRGPAISVIIPAHNEERYLSATLDSLNEQENPPCEIIVIANGCNDRTAEVARNRCDRLIVLSQKCLGIARNLGARIAQGELLMFLDADTTLEPSALGKIAESFSAGHASGTLNGLPESDRLSFRLLYELKNFVHRTHLHAGSSGVILCWKKDFIRVGGFDERLQVRENSELIRRLSRYGKYKFISDVSAVTSMRRYEQKGVGRMVWLWIKLWFQSLFGDLHKKQYETVR